MNAKSFAIAAAAVLVGIWAADILAGFGVDPAAMIATRTAPAA